MHQKFLASADVPKHHYTAPNYYSQLDFSLDPLMASEPGSEAPSGDVSFAGLEAVGTPSNSREEDSTKASVVQTHDPAGWVGCQTSDLQVFYHNVLSRKSEWTRPANCKFDLSKPPPPPPWGILSISEYKSVMKKRDPDFEESTLTTEPTKTTKSETTKTETTDAQEKIEELPAGPDWLVIEEPPPPVKPKSQERPLEWPTSTEVLEAHIGPWKTVEASESAFADVVNEELHECDYLEALREVDALQATRIESEFAAPLDAEDLRLKDPEMVYTSHATAFKKRRRPRR
ncbi:MAG: uncharacterized protein KVP18_004814 [Porospora cf. gigantea A]|uniref:uncharacterized protein n=1 Tax=Porospora cf. gigantea A TaxID=2853593 RepID=UPI003559ADE2|nr:MAG: hypothetical protein KVP18_004814 [Porospora cf. gigantea A]